MAAGLDKLKAQMITADTHSLEVMLRHIANGGTLTNYCVMHGLVYSDVMAVIRADKPALERYKQAVEDRKEWGKERVLSEIKALSTYSLADAFHPDGTRKNVTELPSELVAAIKEVDSDGGIKFSDKLKALQLLGQEFGMFVDRKEINGTLSLEQIILGARKEIGGSESNS